MPFYSKEQQLCQKPDLVVQHNRERYHHSHGTSVPQPESEHDDFVSILFSVLFYAPLMEMRFLLAAS